MGFDQQFLEKTMKNIIFHDFLAVWGLALGSFINAGKPVAANFINWEGLLTEGSG